MARTTIILALATATCLATGSAAAQAVVSEPAEGRIAAAEDLFQRATQLMLSERFAEACPLLAESYRLDPAGGTLQNLAVCYESSGLWASAHARFEELRTLSRNASPPRADRVALAEEHLATIRPRVARIVVEVPPDLADRVVVELDGVRYARAAWSAGIAADPGNHQLRAHAPERAAFATSVVVPNTGGERRVRVPALLPLESERAVDARESRDRRARSIGYVTGGAGLAIFATGGVFGALAITTNEAGKDACRADGGSGAPASDFSPDGRCYEGSGALAQANDAKERAETFANVANVLIPVGILAVGVGAWLVLTHPATASTRALRAPRLGTLLEGTF